jgi:hypothetical protein
MLTRDYLRVFVHEVFIIGLILYFIGFAFLAIYGAVRLAERFGLC